MAKPQNAYLAKIQAQAKAKEMLNSETHVQIDTIAMLLAAHDTHQTGPGRAGNLVNSFLDHKLDIAAAMHKELDEDKSKKKELLIVKRDLVVNLKAILGAKNWEKYKTLFPFLRDFWDWEG